MAMTSINRYLGGCELDVSAIGTDPVKLSLKLNRHDHHHYTLPAPVNKIKSLPKRPLPRPVPNNTDSGASTNSSARVPRSRVPPSTTSNSKTRTHRPAAPQTAQPRRAQKHALPAPRVKSAPNEAAKQSSGVKSAPNEAAKQSSGVKPAPNEVAKQSSGVKSEESTPPGRVSDNSKESNRSEGTVTEADGTSSGPANELPVTGPDSKVTCIHPMREQWRLSGGTRPT